MTTQPTNVNTPIATLQQSIDEIVVWIDKWKLKLNTTKPENKIFTLWKIPSKITSIHTNPSSWKPTDFN